MADVVDNSPLPPGWDRKYDHRTGRHYFINYFNKSTTWEDPRVRYRQLSQATPQHMMPSGSVIESIPMQDLTNIRPSPIPNRAFAPNMGSQAGSAFGSPARFVESSLTTDPEQSVAKISGMFPTVTETHIKTLLMKYLKSVFPKGDETLLLDVLNNSDNNVQKASETLVTMGFEKRDTPPPRLVLKKKEEEARALLEKQQATPTPPPRMKSHEEKQKMKARLQDQYKDIPERVVTIALDSVDYDEERAAQILQIMVQEDSKPKVIEPEVSSKENIREPHSTPVAIPELVPAIESSATCNVTATPEKSFEKHRRPKGKKDVPKVSRGTSTTEDKEYKSPYLMKVCGPSHELYKGPNDQLLLTDYVTWNGPNADFLGKNNSRVSFAKGPNKSLQKVHACLAKGPNIDIWKGPKKGLAKGSIYSQLTAKNSANESRGK